MTLKSRFIDRLRKTFEVSREDAGSIFELFCTIVREELLGSGRIRLSGVFTMQVRRRVPRLVKNVRSGESVQVTGNRLTARPSPEFKPALDGKSMDQGAGDVH